MRERWEMLRTISKRATSCSWGLLTNQAQRGVANACGGRWLANGWSLIGYKGWLLAGWSMVSLLFCSMTGVADQWQVSMVHWWTMGAGWLVGWSLLVSAAHRSHGLPLPALDPRSCQKAINVNSWEFHERQRAGPIIHTGELVILVLLFPESSCGGFFRKDFCEHHHKNDNHHHILSYHLLSYHMILSYHLSNHLLHIISTCHYHLHHISLALLLSPAPLGGDNVKRNSSFRNNKCLGCDRVRVDFMKGPWIVLLYRVYHIVYIHIYVILHIYIFIYICMYIYKYKYKYICMNLKGDTPLLN